MPKITALPAATAGNLTDLVPKVNDPSGVPTTQKMTLAQLLFAARLSYDGTHVIFTAPGGATMQFEQTALTLSAGVDLFIAGGVHQFIDDGSVSFASGQTTFGGDGSAQFANATVQINSVGDYAGTSLASGSYVKWATEKYATANVTNSTATMANIASLSINVVGARKYGFRIILYVTDSVAGEGIQVDFNGGSAGVTNFRAQTRIFDTALLACSQTTALATAVNVATITGNGIIEIDGSFEPSGNGTFIPRFAQNTHATGTATVFRGSHLVMFDLT